jgi:phosphate starvation-inducible protein PhoH
MARRRNKNLSDEDLQQIEEFVYRKNQEEDKFLTSMSVHYKCKNENQGKVRDSIRNNEMTIVSGLPGTGKTYIACAEALKLIKTKPKYKKVLLVKSITQLRHEELGSLPGDLNEKFDPFLGSFIDKLLGNL